MQKIKLQTALRRPFKIIALLMLLGFGFAGVTNLYVIRLSLPHVFEDIHHVPERHTAVVLGALVYQNGSPSRVLRDRLNVALDLYRAQKVKKILVTGDHGSHAYNEVGGMFNWLRHRGVPASDIFLDHAGFRTLDSMKRAAKVFGVTSAIICTQRFHLARAVFLARQSGIDAVGISTDLQKYYRHYINHTREFAARTVSFIETYIIHRAPKFLGPPISIHGDGRATQDQRLKRSAS